MDDYKIDSLAHNTNNLLDNSENDYENLLDPQTLQSFLGVLPHYVQILNESTTLDDEDVTKSIISFYNFAQYYPKDKIAQVLIDSNAIDVLVKYGSNDISNNFSNPIFRKNILRVFNIFTEMSKSDDHTIILKMIQKGVLAICFNNCFITDDEFNKNLSIIIDYFIIKSFFSRGLVYSTGILSSFLNNAEQFSDEIPLSMVQFISGVTRRLVSLGPTVGSKVLEQPENAQKSIDESNQFWNNFIENYYGDPIFVKEYFDDYVSNGIVFCEGSPVFEILKNLIKYVDDDITLLNALKSLFYLVSRDSHLKSDNKICADIIYGRIHFFEYFSDFIETKNLKIIKYALKILTNATFPKNITYDDTILNEMAKIIIDFFVNDIELEFQLNEKIIAFAAQALKNILLIVRDNFTYIEDENNCDKFLAFIYKCLRNGSYKVRKETLIFYLTLVCGYLSNEQVYKSFQENMGEIASIAESNSSTELNLHIIKCLKYIFNIEEDLMDNKRLLEQFISPSIDGFKMIWEFKNDQSNPDLARKAQKFVDEHYDFYQLENNYMNGEIEIQYDIGENEDQDDDDDPSDFFYKGKKV